MAGPLTSMGNLARIAKIVALLLFVLPWVTVSCSPQGLGPAAGAPPGMTTGSGDMVLVRATGVQLATGSATPINPNPSASPPPNPFAAPNYAILGGALLILLSLAASFLLKGRNAVLAAAAGSALAAAALAYAVLIDIPRLVHASFASGAGAGAGEGSPINPAELARMIQVKAEIGFWLTLVALIAAVILNVLAMKGTAAVVAPAAAAPPADPPPTG